MENLRFKLLNASVGAKMKVDEAVKTFVTRKKLGDSHFLAVALLLLIVVAISITFRTSLGATVGNVFSKVDSTVNGIIVSPTP